MAAKRKPRAPKPPKPKKVNPYPIIVGNLVEIPKGATKTFWPREIKLAKNLCERYGLEKVKAWKPASKYPSIAFLLVVEKDLEGLLERNFMMMKLKPQSYTPPKLEETPVTEEREFSKKDNTIKSWLK